jgi:nucleoid-associated protein YgaU
MGIFDKLKKAVGGGEPERDTTVAPSQLLRDAGIDPSGLKLGFGTGTISVSGTIADETDRGKIIEVLSGIDGINSVEDHMTVAAPEPPPAPAPEPTPEPPPAVEPADTAPEAPAEEGRTYTVVSGDSLWKIAEAMYGNGAKYTKIFDANRDILDDPDKIFPGQVLKIPDLDD